MIVKLFKIDAVQNRCFLFNTLNFSSTYSNIYLSLFSIQIFKDFKEYKQTLSIQIKWQLKSPAKSDVDPISSWRSMNDQSFGRRRSRTTSCSRKSQGVCRLRRSARCWCHSYFQLRRRDRDCSSSPPIGDTRHPRVRGANYSRDRDTFSRSFSRTRMTFAS